MDCHDIYSEVLEPGIASPCFQFLSLTSSLAVAIGYPSYLRWFVIVVPFASFGAIIFTNALKARYSIVPFFFRLSLACANLTVGTYKLLNIGVTCTKFRNCTGMAS